MSDGPENPLFASVSDGGGSAATPTGFGPGDEADDDPGGLSGDVPKFEGSQVPVLDDLLVALIGSTIRGLTYREIHAFVLGAVPWILALVTGHPVLLAAAVGITVASLGLGRAGSDGRLGRAVRTVVREPWYCLGGALSGWVAGSMILALARVLGALVGVVA